LSRYPQTITNGGGEELTFLGHERRGSQDRLLVENSVTPGSGPPMHVHFLQEEALTVVSGRIGYQTDGGEARYAGPGETVVFAPGVMHRFWNAGEDQLHCRGFVSPPHNVEFFLSAIFESTRANGGERPHPMDAAYLLTRYRTEFALAGIPDFVRRFVFPLLVLVGRLTGRYRKYAGAPEPVRR
jgi:mannose-6-phosphate isomerase-like protein (cupin superfamily)